ncbi:MAG: hypothetical protein ACYCX9_13190 [Candidatus Dormibacteria bacterium]
MDFVKKSPCPDRGVVEIQQLIPAASTGHRWVSSSQATGSSR